MTANEFDCPETTGLILAEEPFLHRLARRLARRNADAEDLVQETMMRAYDARARFVPGTSMRAWLATILRRLHLTQAFKEKRRATQTDTDADEPLERVARVTVAFAHVPEAGYEPALQQVDDPMKAAIDHLPELYRTPFLLFALDGLSYADIARRLGIPVGTVMSRIHRARIRVQRDLAASQIVAA